MAESWRVARHRDLSLSELELLRTLFDGEYLAEYGEWNPDAPYGYSPAYTHILGFDGPSLVAHVGFQRRVIEVGGREVLVAGTGGVLVEQHCRSVGFGQRALQRAQQAMREDAEITFGYLGCREEIVPFYESAGWHRIHAIERHLSRLDQHAVVAPTGSPILICSAAGNVSEWPEGDIDLLGTPW